MIEPLVGANYKIHNLFHPMKLFPAKLQKLRQITFMDETKRKKKQFLPQKLRNKRLEGVIVVINNYLSYFF